MYVSRLGMQFRGPSGAAHVQDGVPTSYTDTDFALLAHEGPEISLDLGQVDHFVLPLLQLQHD